jgi:hypothetical protein
MIRKYFAYAVLPAAVAVTGCAAWRAPDADLATRLPIIEIGQPKPDTKEYILRVPARKPIPVIVTFDGSFLTEEGAAETAIQVRQDVYLYKQWASFDGKIWQRSHSIFDTRLGVGLDTEGGKVEIKLDEKR